MSVDAGKAKLSRAAKDLAARWAAVRGLWTDAVAREFEAGYITPLEKDVRQALAAMDHLGEVLTRVRQECS